MELFLLLFISSDIPFRPLSLSRSLYRRPLSSSSSQSHFVSALPFPFTSFPLFPVPFHTPFQWQCVSQLFCVCCTSFPLSLSPSPHPLARPHPWPPPLPPPPLFIFQRLFARSLMSPPLESPAYNNVSGAAAKTNRGRNEKRRTIGLSFACTHSPGERPLPWSGEECAAEWNK